MLHPNQPSASLPSRVSASCEGTRDPGETRWAQLRAFWARELNISGKCAACTLLPPAACWSAHSVYIFRSRTIFWAYFCIFEKNGQWRIEDDRILRRKHYLFRRDRIRLTKERRIASEQAKARKLFGQLRLGSKEAGSDSPDQFSKTFMDCLVREQLHYFRT